MTGDAWDATEDGLSALPLRVLVAPEWRVEDDVVHLAMPRTGQVARMRPRVAAILAAVRDGATQADLVRAAVAAGWAREDAVKSVRRLVAALAQQGNVRVELPPVPSAFDGRFRVLRELGRGGVGVAWLCEDAETGEAAVVKHAWNWSGPLAARDALLREEGDVLSRLSHPGVPRLLHRFDVDGRHHLARAFAPGEDLAAWRTAAAPAPAPEERARILRAVGAILSHMHQRGLLCLDVNPANFIRSAEGDVVLADPGHARAMDAPPPAKRSWGAREYAAPDVADGGPAYSPRADVHGLAALLAFLIEGRPPRVDGAPPEGATKAESGFLAACLHRPAAERPATVDLALRLLG